MRLEPGQVIELIRPGCSVVIDRVRTARCMDCPSYMAVYGPGDADHAREWAKQHATESSHGLSYFDEMGNLVGIIEGAST